MKIKFTLVFFLRFENKENSLLMKNKVIIIWKIMHKTWKSNVKIYRSIKNIFMNNLLEIFLSVRWNMKGRKFRENQDRKGSLNCLPEFSLFDSSAVRFFVIIFVISTLYIENLLENIILIYAHKILIALPLKSHQKCSVMMCK
jgi:hypothetical protein